MHMKVIVTGASTGIGRGIASVLAAEGYSVGLLARSADRLEALQGELEGRRPDDEARYAIAPCDLRDPAAVEQAIGALVHRLGGLDALVNNAGLIIRKDVFSISPDEWRAMMETNVNGLFYATRAALPVMRAQGRGHIVNISSISGRVPLPGGSGYAASKYAVTGFSESLLQEVRGFGIKVTTIFPGSVASESHRSPDQDDSWKVRPEDVGQAIAHLLRTPAGVLISQLEIRPLRVSGK